MDASDRKQLKEKIEALITQSEREIREMEDMTQPVKPENSLGRISRMDAINNKSVQEAALRTKRNRYTQLKIAAIKIEEEGFGTCLRCQRPIQAARLMYMPESAFCVRCAK